MLPTARAILGVGFIVAAYVVPTVPWARASMRFRRALQRIPSEVSVGYANRVTVEDPAALSSGQRRLVSMYRTHTGRDAIRALTVFMFLAAVGFVLFPG